MTPLLRARKLSRQLPAEVPVMLVEDIDLQIEAGEFIVIMGPSGSGKSSLLYLLGLLDKPSRGEVALEGEDTAVLDEDTRADRRLRKLGFVFQFHFLLAEFSCLQNVVLPMRKLAIRGPQATERRAGELLDSLGLLDQASKRPSQLSGGQRQRVAIARALANDPSIILADEPTGNLDSVSSAAVRDVLRDLAGRLGKTIIAVTHDVGFAAAADRRIGLVDGKIDPTWEPPTLSH